MENQTRISNYDEFNYDYSTFWKNRGYEHNAEEFALQKLLSKLTGDWAIDIGGSYGRNIPLISKKFHKTILMDYSIKALEQARDTFKKTGIDNVELVAANVYNMPFKNNSFDAAMMIRVLHHIEKTPEGIGEIARTISSDSHLILEFANKFHIKAILRAILTLNFKFLFSNKPYLQPSRGNQEGVKGDIPGIIYNYSPKYIKTLLKENGFKIEKRKSVSFLRIPFIKRLLPLKTLLFFEKILQTIFSWSLITPSLIYKLKKSLVTNTEDNIKSAANSSALEDILCCPKCKSSLKKGFSELICHDCNLKFKISGKIYDLRYPQL